MNSLALRFLATLVALACFSFTGEVRAQLRTPPTVKVPQKEMRPSPAPNVLYEQLTRPDPNSQFLELRIDGMDILAIGGSEIEDVRLTYEDLDGGGIPEAIFRVKVPGANVSLVVLKRKGNQWYRLDSPKEFSCWCKYENSPLDILAEIRAWPYSGGREPAKLLFVRESGGGTGLYERVLHIYTLRGFEFKEAFNVMEERRECGWPDDNCDLHHVEITPAYEFKQPAALVTTRYEQHLPGRDVYTDRLLIGLPVQRCTSYTRDAKREEFIENPEATEAYCSHLGPQRSLAPLNRSPAP